MTLPGQPGSLGQPGPPAPLSDPRGRRGSGRLRQVGWASVPVWSFGFLAFAPFLRLALERRRARDWAVFAAYAVVVAGLVVLLSVSPSTGAGPTLAGGTIFALMGFAGVHALVAFRPAADSLAAPEPPEPLAPGPANRQALEAARSRMKRRSEARGLARKDPALARELRIGRPDVPHEYDDGGLVDVNHVPIAVLAPCLGLTPQEATAVAAARDQLGRFSSPEELSAYAQLAPDRVDDLRELMFFG